MLNELRKARLAHEIRAHSSERDREIYLKARLAKKRAEFQGVLLNPMWARLESPAPVLEAAE